MAENININPRTEEQKRELGNLIWNMATNLVHGGTVSPVQFMDYTLGALFYRFISENITDYCNQLMKDAGVADADYANMSDENAENARNQIINAKGIFILPSQLFINVANSAKNNTELNTTLSNIFRAIENSATGKPSESDVKGLFDNFKTDDQGLGATVNERNETLTTLLESVRDLDFQKYKESGIDVFGYCYEYLIKMYALNSGTKGGEFYTPSEVSYLLAMIAAAGRTSVNKVYDPACGSGSLLLNFNLVLGAKNVKDGFYGQEINVRTYNLCRMNMFLHDINYDHFDIQRGDTLKNPLHESDEPFDAIVSNPPYSRPWDGDSDATLINDPRFSPAGVLAPKGKSDFAFTMHTLSWLSAEGTAAIVEFPGVLYRSGAEQKIRKYLVSNNYVDTVVQLAANMFFGTPIATCLLILKKNKADNRVCFIDASNEFIHEGNKNKLSPENISKIYNTYMNKEEIAHFSHVVTIADIAEKDYNLSVSTYVEQKDTREKIDINELNARIAEIVSREELLRKDIDEIVAKVGRRCSMKGLDEMIKELCPDGVEFVKLGECCNFVNGFAFKSTKFKEKGDTIIRITNINGTGVDVNDVKYFDKSDYKANWQTFEIHKGDILIAMSGATTGKVGIYNNKTVAYLNQRVGKIVPDKSKLVNRFLYHILLSKTQFLYMLAGGGAQPNLSSTKLMNVFEIPLPPIEVQTEIVRILDKFTSLEAELEAGLEAELDCRKRQYEYYRDKLLSFDNVGGKK